MSGFRGPLPRTGYWPLETPTGGLQFKGYLDPEIPGFSPLGHFCTEEGGPAPLPSPPSALHKNPTAFSWSQVRTQVRLLLPPTRDSQAPGVEDGSRPGGGALPEADLGNVRPIHQGREGASLDH
jgi:hypothetical protein